VIRRRGSVAHAGISHLGVEAAQRACEEEDLELVGRALTELVEAGARTGRLDVAGAGLRRIASGALGSATDWALGMPAQSQALLAEGADADVRYREAIERFGNSGASLQGARAQLLYGEWLRRERRRVDARIQLRPALEMFSRICAGGFAERARRELLATGETVRKRTFETRDELTAQELQVARLAAEGHTNPEIGAQLFISPRTVQYHLHKVFAKLGISSRRELGGALPPSSQPPQPSAAASAIPAGQHG
jgi:DNA-binding CsgD family transcriptional regulator